jgi:DNA-binding transcriptional ArsR family regulator
MWKGYVAFQEAASDRCTGLPRNAHWQRMPGGRLTDEDRRHIAAGLADGLGYAEIARRLGRPTSTVSREVARNGGFGGYGADQARTAAALRAGRRGTPRPAATPAHGARDPAAVGAFVERFAALMTETGVPRMPARVLTCLLVTDAGALTAAELVQRLAVSPASVSKAIAYLEGLGLVRRARDPRSRRDRYLVDDDAWWRAWTVNARANLLWAQAAEQGADILGPATPAGTRVRALGEFFSRLGADMSGADALSGVGDDPAGADALTVLAALLHAGAPLPRERLAVALGWSADRVARATARADGRLTDDQRRALDADPLHGRPA